MADINSSQQIRALTASTVAFTTCFAVWTIFSIIGLQIQKDLHLSETEFGLLVGTLIPVWSVPLGYLMRPYQIVRRR